MANPDAPHILIVESRFYEDVADELLKGANGANTHSARSGIALAPARAGRVYAIHGSSFHRPYGIPSLADSDP